MKQADDAVRIDTTGMSITEVVAAIQQIVDQKWNNQPLALVDLKQNRTILMRNFIKYRNFRVEILFELWGFRSEGYFLYETVILKQNSEGNVFENNY